jgi:hypothetical protein
MMERFAQGVHALLAAAAIRILMAKQAQSWR